MTSTELRQKFLEFFEKNRHKVVPSSSLLPADPSVLFTTAGMQQFKPYFLGEKSPHGNKVASCQKCFRTSDIEEVGDERHLTFFEMLGNFSFGGYGKETAVKLAKEFLDSINIKIDYVTVFSGDKDVPEDKESKEIWKKLGVSDVREAGRNDNFWGPTGDEGPCGPTTEIYAGGLEIWNLVFNEYYQDKNKKLTSLKQKGVDTGMGLERLAMVSQGKSNIFETDLFSSIISGIPGDNEKAKRIITDHVKAAVFLISEGILPSNVERGYVVRRLLRRVISFGKLLNLQNDLLITLIPKVVALYGDIYSDLAQKQVNIIKVINNESERFEGVLEKGIKEMGEIVINLKEGGARAVGAGDTLRIEQSSGVPFEIQKEFFAAEGMGVQQEEHEAGREKHKEISRAGAESKFGGGGELSPALHTGTHLLHAALREVLGKHVQQMGSDINPQRLRFDFSHLQRMTPEEIKKVEEMVNEKIKENFDVERREMSYDDAIKSGALAFFKEKYPDRVSVYSVGNFSREICAGPHVKKTGELGHFKITKEESSGAGVRRIRAILE